MLTCAFCLRKAHHDHHRVYGERSPGRLPEGEEGRASWAGECTMDPWGWLLVWEEETLPIP